MSALIAAGAAHGASGDAPRGDGREPRCADAASPTLRVEVEPTGAELELDGDPVTFTVSVWNLSPIVDAYRIQAAAAPRWLDVTVRRAPAAADHQRPGADHRPDPARARSRSRAARGSRLADPVGGVPAGVPRGDLDLTVPASEVPVTLRLEPSVVKVKDAASGRLQVVVDNVAGEPPAGAAAVRPGP